MGHCVVYGSRKAISGGCFRAVSDALTMDFSLEAEGNGFSSASSVEKEHLAPLYYAVLRLHKVIPQTLVPPTLFNCCYCLSVLFLVLFYFFLL